MDDFSGKRAGNGLVVSRRGSTVVLRDTDNNRDRNAQFCNRIGCSGRLNSAKGTHQINCSEKAKSSRPPFRASSNGKEVIGSSSRNSSATSNPRKFLPGPRKKQSSQPEKASSETCSSQDEPEEPQLVIGSGNIRNGLSPKSSDAACTENATTEVGSSRMTSTRSRRSFHQKYGIGKPDSQIGLPVSLASKSTSPVTRPVAGRYGLRNLRCSSTADVVPTGPSASDSNITGRKDTIKKRSCDGESSSSARGKKISGSALDCRSSSSTPGISISGTRRIRNGPPNRDNGPASVRTQRSVIYTRARGVDEGNWNNLSPNEPRVVISQMSQPIMSIDSDSPGSSHQLSMESSFTHSRSYGRPGSSGGNFQGIRPSSPEFGNIHSPMNREIFRRYNMDGIAEVLLTLERIEQDEELTYEQLLALETSLFLNGLNFSDQHRDMRLDIDNMSYEELLALEESMGTVSTALTEEALSECLKASNYQSASLEYSASDLSGEKDDVKCSICQEEYTVGDEVGSLQCEHRYHIACIHQWLRLKNWCPICKASAAPSSSLPPPPLEE